MWKTNNSPLTQFNLFRHVQRKVFDCAVKNKTSKGAFTVNRCVYFAALQKFHTRVAITPYMGSLLD